MKRIPLSQKKFAMVDDDLFAELNKHRWHVVKDDHTDYARRWERLIGGSGKGRGTHTSMHREIFKLRGLPIPREVDHRDRNGLNNQFKNLRPANRRQQTLNRVCPNTSGFIGVSWYKPKSKWRAQSTTSDGTKKHLGYFSDPFSAAWVRDEFVRRHHGEFAVTNNLVDRRKGDRRSI